MGHLVFEVHTARGGQRRRPRSRTVAVLAVISLALCAAGAIAAQSSETGLLEEVVVTATKRSEPIQDVTMSVTAFDSAAIDRNVITSLADMPVVPNVTLSSISVQPYGIVSYIRGIGNKSQEPELDPGVAISVDGVYLANATGALFNFFDVRQVEVLESPQGTLQGRNSPGGAINVSTVRPSGQFGLQAEAGYASYDDLEGKLAVEAPLIADKLAIRASLYRESSEGDVRNLYNGGHTAGIDVNAARVSVLFTPNDLFSLFISADYVEDHSQQTGLQSANTSTAYANQPVSLLCSAFKYCTPDAPHTTTSDYTEPFNTHFGGESATADWQLGGATLTSVTGYREMHEQQNTDIDGTPVPLLAVVDRTFNSDTLSEELRLTSKKGGNWDLGGKLDWLVGGITYHSEFDVNQPVAVFGALSSEYYSQKLDSNAVFATATYHVSDAWSVSGGVRHTTDDKDFQGYPSGYTPASMVYLSHDWSNTSFDAETKYQLSEGKMVYARFAQGYRSGGMSLGGTPEDTSLFQPETVNSYEVGAKTDWLDRRLLANLSAFLSNYDNLQLSVTEPSASGQGFAEVIRNAAKARIEGAEVELLGRPLDALTLRFNGGYLDAHYTSFYADLVGDGVITNNNGLRLPFAPKYSASTGADYAISMNRFGSITLGGTVNYVGAHTTAPADLPVGNQNGYTVVDIQVMYKSLDQRYAVTGYIKNLFDRNYIIAGEDVSNVALYQVYGPPRIAGVRFTVKL